MSKEIKLTFLGTSDSVPTASRNHPSIWVNFYGENILVDCGEGTQRQIRRAKMNPCKINKILITHWHADHVLGIPGLLKTLEMSGYRKTLNIYGPKGIKKKINSLFDVFGGVKEYDLVVEEVSGRFFETEHFYLEAEKMTHGISCNAYSMVLKDQLRIDKKKIKKAKISSGPHLKKLKEGKNIFYKGKRYLSKSLTYVEKGKKISFVLDTSLNDKISKFVKNSDIFVSESTFTSDFEEKAKEHKHLTAKQVATIAKKAKIGKLFLIHVSQRFSKNSEEVLKEAKKVFKNSFMPHDLDSVKL